MTVLPLDFPSFTLPSPLLLLMAICRYRTEVAYTVSEAVFGPGVNEWHQESPFLRY